MLKIKNWLKAAQDEIKFTDWFIAPKALEVARRLEGCVYYIAFSKTKPKINPLDFKKRLIRIGTSCGKGYGSKGTDRQADDTYRQMRRKATSQPYDRLHDHITNLREGTDSNQYIKNHGGAQKSWSPVLKMYGDIKNSLRVNLKHIWIAFAIPNENLLFDQQVLRCELVELTSIANHKYKFNNEAPLSDLKYADKNQKEIQNLLALKFNQSGRLTRISKDNEYQKRPTQNDNAFHHNLMTIMDEINAKNKKTA